MTLPASSVLGRALSFARHLREAGEGVTLLVDGETATAWVGRAAKVHALPPGSAPARRVLERLAGRSAFFLVGPRSSGGLAPQEEPGSLIVEHDLEVEFGVGGWRATLGSLPAGILPSSWTPPSALDLPGPAGLPPGWEGDGDPDFRAAVQGALARLGGRAGKVILTRGFRRACPGGRDPFDLAALLLLAEPEAAASHLCLLPGGATCFGTSPELVFRVEGGLLTVDAVAGSRPRPADPQASSGLLDSEKEAREHALALDRASALVANFCGADPPVRRFTRHVRRLRAIEHLQSRVEGRLAPDQGALDLLEACHPPLLSYPGDLRGPGEPAWTTPRFYGGQVGRLGGDGSFRSFLNLRCVELAEGFLQTRAGVGVVAGADPDREVEESLLKLATIFATVECWTCA